MLTYATVAVIALLLSLMLTPLVRFGVRCLGAVDAPDRRRKMHRRAVPTLGGLAVVGGFAGALLTLRFLLDSPTAAGAEGDDMKIKTNVRAGLLAAPDDGGR